MARKNLKKGKIVKHLVAGTIFDVRVVPEISVDMKTNKISVKTSSHCLFLGKRKLKDGFKSIEEASEWVVSNLNKYDKKTKRFA